MSSKEVPEKGIGWDDVFFYTREGTTELTTSPRNSKHQVLVGFFRGVLQSMQSQATVYHSLLDVEVEIYRGFATSLHMQATRCLMISVGPSLSWREQRYIWGKNHKPKDGRALYLRPSGEKQISTIRCSPFIRTPQFLPPEKLFWF